MVALRYRIYLTLLLVVLFTYTLEGPTVCFGQTANQQAPQEVKFSARFHIEKGKQRGFVIVRADIKKGCYIYGLKQTKPLLPSKLELTKIPQLKMSGKFKADKPAKVIDNDPIFKTRVEKHVGTVQFYVPIEIASGVDPAKIQPLVLFSGQVCSDEGYCAPINKQKITAKFAGFFERQAKGFPQSSAKRQKSR